MKLYPQLLLLILSSILAILLWYLMKFYCMSTLHMHITGILYFCDPENTASTVLPPRDIVPETLHHYNQYA